MGPAPSPCPPGMSPRTADLEGAVYESVLAVCGCDKLGVSGTWERAGLCRGLHCEVLHGAWEWTETMEHSTVVGTQSGPQVGEVGGGYRSRQQYCHQLIRGEPTCLGT